MARKQASPGSQKRQPPTPLQEVADSENLADLQREEEYKVGPGCPPREYQFPPGQSGNPHGQPKHRTHLWTHYCRYLAMTPRQIRQVDRAKLTLAERAALRLALAVQKGQRCPSERFARYMTDRDEGRAVEHVLIGAEEPLTDEECDQIRQVALRNHADPDK